MSTRHLKSFISDVRIWLKCGTYRTLTQIPTWVYLSISSILYVTTIQYIAYTYRQYKIIGGYIYIQIYVLYYTCMDVWYIPIIEDLPEPKFIHLNFYSHSEHKRISSLGIINFIIRQQIKYVTIFDVYGWNILTFNVGIYYIYSKAYVYMNGISNEYMYIK